MPSKTAQYICSTCRYSTPNTSAMKTHNRTNKHRQNKLKTYNVILSDDEKQNVLKENIERRKLAGLQSITFL